VVGDDCVLKKSAEDPPGRREEVLKNKTLEVFFSWRLSRYRQRHKKKGGKSCRLG
jgi:hypothetical protein